MKTILTLCALAICGAFTLHAADDNKPKKPHDGKPGDGKPGGMKHNPEEIFKKLDTNNDGFLSKDEFMAGPRAKEDPAKAAEHFKMLDKKGDGKITFEEFKAAHDHKRPGGPPKKPDGDNK
ncbi:MAG: EF-hand domain-containing protein [Verrucomicrobia bacterium]|nr:EF-hand domain-containing protein [Verrucomicrobiota bacterium]